MSGIDTSTLKAHSIRGAVTTEVARQGFSILTSYSLQTGRNQNTFIKFYYRPQFNAAPGLAVFSSDTNMV